MNGATLILFAKFPGATFIQGGTFIPDSRVYKFEEDMNKIKIKHDNFLSN